VEKEVGASARKRTTERDRYHAVFTFRQKIFKVCVSQISQSLRFALEEELRKLIKN
jgi:hypothetical protein